MSTPAAQCRARLNHPVVDADGHWLEFGPLVDRELRRIGGDRAADGFARFAVEAQRALEMTVAERHRQRVAAQLFWGVPVANVRDRATAMMPALLYERLPELGIDFMVLFPTAGLGAPRIVDASYRLAACRAFNTFCAGYFAPYADRMTPAALIPMFTPDEALAELDFVTGQLGLKVVLLGSLMPRHAEGSNAPWRDVIGIDSAYDYEPVWQRCLDLRVSPLFHTGSRGWGLRASPSNFVYNHIGHFATASEAVCKALFLGGVTRRFPGLKIGFLEGGVGWACQLFGDLIEHWEKRKRRTLEDFDPGKLDRAALLDLARKYAGADVAAMLEREGAALEVGVSASHEVGGLAELDDFAACRIEDERDWIRLFVEPFYFGCEPDDRMNAWAFDRRCNPCGVKLNAMFGSDVGHFDVLDMGHVLPEAYEMLEQELIEADDFARFVFTNAVRFYGGPNPSFFVGTAVEEAALQVLAAPPAPP